jgi:hypothetical protein
MFYLNHPLLKTALFSTFVLTCLAPLPQVMAQTADPLVFTEYSSALLTATVGGVSYGTVTLGPANHWIWTPPDGVQVVYPANPNHWIEPEDPSLVNDLRSIYTIPQPERIIAMDILSDVNEVTGNQETFVNGQTDPLFTISGGTPVVGLTFIDLGDASVPDQSSSLVLLFIAGFALFGSVRLGMLQRC